MTHPKYIQGLSEIRANYDVLLCDIWGVLHNGRDVFWSAFEALKQFKQEQNGFVILISNSPRPGHKVQEQIAGLVNARFPLKNFLQEEKLYYNAIITSGDASYGELKRLAPGPAFKLGPKRDDPLYEGLGMRFSDPETARFISCTGLFHDENETIEDYQNLLQHCRNKNLPMVCVNPDLYVQKGDRILPCGGALAALYHRLGGKVIYAGKPHPPIYQQAREIIQTSECQQGKIVHKKRMLAIGDGLKTDIAGACREGIDALYITQGLIGLEERAENNRNQKHKKEENIQQHLKQQKLKVRYILSVLQW